MTLDELVSALAAAMADMADEQGLILGTLLAYMADESTPRADRVDRLLTFTQALLGIDSPLLADAVIGAWSTALEMAVDIAELTD